MAATGDRERPYVVKMVQIIENLDTGEISGKYCGETIKIPPDSELNLKNYSMKDIAIGLLSPAITRDVTGCKERTDVTRLKQGFKAVDQLTAWLEKRHGAGLAPQNIPTLGG